MTSARDNHASIISSEIAARPEQVRAAVDLLEGGSTIPFIARYRKEATGGLDDGKLRQLEERLPSSPHMKLLERDDRHADN